MKNVKRSIAIILFLAIVMTGICWSEKPVKEVQAAAETEANTEMLELKLQRGITDETINKIRVVASVDSPNYSAVGFGIDKGDGNGETLFTINTKQYPLPQKIKSSVTGMEYAFNPKVVDTSSEYFLTAKWTAVENTKYTVRAWVKTFDGEMVFGQSRCITLADLSTTEYLNMSFELKAGCELTKTAQDETKYEDIVVAYNGTSTTAEVISVKTNENGGQTVHVNVRNVNRTALPSVTEFVFKDSEGAELGDNSFRNLYKSYTGTADTTWYDANETEFVIATTADLYGFAALVNGTAGVGDPIDFQEKTIYLASDITINEGWKPTINPSTGVLSGAAPQYSWTPIGTESAFVGTFDGQGNTIQGLYSVYNNTNADLSERVGLFGTAQTGSVLKNFKITNSYFYSNPAPRSDKPAESHAYMGSVVGELRGTLEGVYSDAIVTSTGRRAGGLIGYINGYNDATKQNTTVNIKNSWFDGQVSMSGSNGTYAAGIVGFVNRGTVNIVNVLFSGKIMYKGTETTLNTGGIIGSNNLAYNVNLINCLSTGRFNVEGTANTTGSIVGNLNKSGSVLTTQNTYATNECFVKGSTPMSYGNFAASTTHTNISKTSHLVAENTILGDLAKSQSGIPNLFTIAQFDGETEVKWITLQVQNKDGQIQDTTPILKDFEAWWLQHKELTKVTN